MSWYMAVSIIGSMNCNNSKWSYVNFPCQNIQQFQTNFLLYIYCILFQYPQKTLTIHKKPSIVEVWFVHTDAMSEGSETPGFYPKNYVKAINFSNFSKGSDRSGIRMYGLLTPYVRCWTAVFFFFLKYRTCYIFCTCDDTWILEGKILLHLTFQILICFRFYCFKEISVFSSMILVVNWE